VGPVSVNQNVYLFGDYSTEVFYNSGDADAPFQRIQGAVVGVGCSAAHSIARIQNAVYWLGGDDTGTGIIYRMQGYQAERISTPAIEAVIRGVATTDLANARAWTYQQGGHVFYCLNIPTVDSTWVYDASTQMWHERQYLDLWSMKRHRADCHALAYGQNVVGDWETGAIYALDPDTYTDNGTSIARIRRAPHHH
jgi:outer membrane protein assembly factor BamB